MRRYGVVTIVLVLAASVPLLPADAGMGPISFAVYRAPAELPNHDGAGEPSIGVDWIAGTVMLQAFESTYRVDFDDATFPAIASWGDTSYQNVINIDPILFTDSARGRTYAGGLGTACSQMMFSDDDGTSWNAVVNACSGTADHETIGAGPWHGAAPLASTSPRAVYYCATTQTMTCATSWNGGLTFNVPTLVGGACTGFAGHIKVAPDGTAFVPNGNCGANVGGFRTQDNGASWASYAIPGSASSDRGFDPSIAAARDNVVFESWTQAGSHHPYVARSTDRGASWDRTTDLANTVSPPIVASAFPAVVAGDPGRVAVAFLGTSVGSGSILPYDPGFQGVWYLYVSYSFNGGLTWTTVKADPDPVQRGCIWDGGGTHECRNLLDFMDAAVTKEGRVVVGYADGCLACATSAESTHAWATIARQSTGRTLFASDDLNGAMPPGAPTLDAVTAGGGRATLSWTPPALDGGTPITSYRVYRSTAPGAETLLATAGDATTWTDTGLANGQVYYYRVAAFNGAGLGPLSNEASGVPADSSAPPSACLTDAESSLTVTVDGGCSGDPDGFVAAYDWTWGDGSAHASGSTASHTYAAAGAYTVALTVADNGGSTALATRDVTVSAAGDPDPSTPTLTPWLPATATSGAQDSWQLYKVKVPAGKSTFKVTLDGPACSPGLRCNPDLDLFVKQGGPPQRWSYSCAPQDASSDESCSFTLPNADWWYVGAYVYQATRTASYKVSVSLAPADANVPPTPCFTHAESGAVASVDGSCSVDDDGAISSYDWSWGDGAAHGTGRQTSHSYARGGTYDVVLTARDSAGATATRTQSLTVLDPPNQIPAACFGVTRSLLDASFDASCSTDSDGTLASYAWDFGDGGSGSGRTVAHSFPAAGTYDVTLAVTDDDGATATLTQRVSVTADPDPATPTLASGTTATDSIQGADSWKYYKIKVPAGQSRLRVDLGSDQACTAGLRCNPDLDLLVRQSARPTATAFNCAPRTTSSSESCAVNAPAADWWYVGVHVFSGAAALNYAVTATYSP